MAASEIGAAASHLKTYRYIIKNNIQQCIIMEDDCFPSILFKEWAYNKINLQDKQIFSFYSYANGFVHKKICRTFLEKINIHKSKTHLFNSACYQININTCKKFIEITNNKVSYPSDWNINLEKNKIRLYVTIPFIVLIDDKNISYLREGRNKILQKNLCIRKKNYKFITKTLSHIYTLSLFRFFLGSAGKYSYFYEQYLKKSVYLIINYFNNKYYDMNKIYYDEKYYTNDLVKNCNSFFKNLNSQK